MIERAGTRLWTRATGAGVPVVLCSGGPGCCDYLAPVAALLDPIAQVIRFDARGCGRSDHAATYSVQTCLDDLELIRQAYGIARWIVAGHSWGADLALAYALHYPQHTRGFVCLAGGRVHNDRTWHAAYEQGRAAGLEPPLDFDYPPNMDVNAQVGADWKQYIQRPTLLRDIAQLDRPALFVYGERDIRPGWCVEQVAQLLPRARFVRFDEANHYLWHTHAAPLGDVMREFVDQIEDA